MTEAKRATADDGILDALDAIGLARVNGDRKHFAREVLESSLVKIRHEALFGAGDVEANHAVIAVANGQLCNLKTAI